MKFCCYTIYDNRKRKLFGISDLSVRRDVSTKLREAIYLEKMSGCGNLTL